MLILHGTYCTSYIASYKKQLLCESEKERDMSPSLLYQSTEKVDI